MTDDRKRHAQRRICKARAGIRESRRRGRGAAAAHHDGFDRPEVAVAYGREEVVLDLHVQPARHREAEPAVQRAPLPKPPLLRAVRNTETEKGVRRLRTSPKSCAVTIWWR